MKAPVLDNWSFFYVKYFYQLKFIFTDSPCFIIS